MHIAGTVLYNQHFLVTTSKYAYRMLQILVGLWLTATCLADHMRTIACRNSREVVSMITCTLK